MTYGLRDQWAIPTNRYVIGSHLSSGALQAAINCGPLLEMICGFVCTYLAWRSQVSATERREPGAPAPVPRRFCIPAPLPVIQTSVLRLSIHSGRTSMTKMTNIKSGSVSSCRLLGFAVLLLAATSSLWAQSRPAAIEKLAKTYGVDSWGQVDAVRYTWNAQFPGINVSRTWEWEPKTGKVTYEVRTKRASRSKFLTCSSELSGQSDTR